MRIDSVTVRPRHAAELVLSYLRLRRELPLTTDTLIVVNGREVYLGVLPITKLLTADLRVTVRKIMSSEEPPIHVTESDTEVARLFSERDLVSEAVVDNAGHLVGRITIDNVVDIIIEGAEKTVLAPAGLLVDEDTLHLRAGLFDGMLPGLASIS